MGNAVKKSSFERGIDQPPPALRLVDLKNLAAADIETNLVANLSRDLHSLFDPVSDDALPIYFGPLLGRLYLEGL